MRLIPRVQDEHEDCRGDSQPYEAVADEARAPFALIGRGNEDPPDQKEKPHEEGLGEALVEHEYEPGADAQGAGFLVVPGTDAAVRDANVHEDDHHNDQPAHVVDEIEP